LYLPAHQPYLHGAVVQILLGKLRLRMWRRWERQAQAAPPGAFLPPPFGSPPHSPLDSKALDMPAAGAAAAVADKASAQPHINGTTSGAGASKAQQPSDVEKAVAGMPDAAPLPAAGAEAGAAEGEAGVAAVGSGSSSGGIHAKASRWAGRVRQRWRFQPGSMPGVKQFLVEAGICFLQAFNPNTGKCMLMSRVATAYYCFAWQRLHAACLCPLACLAMLPSSLLGSRLAAAVALL